MNMSDIVRVHGQGRLPAILLGICVTSPLVAEEEFQPLPLQAEIRNVQPMTGIVLWAENEHARTAPIQLEFSYLRYADVITGPREYNWSKLETLLDQIASRQHQAIIRWHDTYVGRPTGVPDYIKQLPDYRETLRLSEKKQTGFPDWSHPGWQQCVLDFFSELARKYDRDPRLAVVQVGFGLWSEYHIYDGPMQLGKTFPTREYQADFARHLATVFQETPWQISVDAADNHTPFASQRELLQLNFGLFDDSFNHRQHTRENEPNWNLFGRDRWQRSPMGGEFAFFERADQRLALAPQGAHGEPFEQQAARFHLSWIIGDDQPRLQAATRLREAGLATGYRFHITRFEGNATSTRIEIENRGIAPIYFDAYPAIDGVRSETSLKHLLPGERRWCTVAGSAGTRKLTIDCDRLVPGQRIEFAAQLPASETQTAN